MTMSLKVQTQDSVIVLSRHASLRICQRNIPRDDLELVLRYGESACDVGDGCVAISIRRSQMSELCLAGVPIARLERLARIVVIIAGDGTIVTAINRETRFARFLRGPSRLTCRERALKAARRQRGRITRGAESQI